ncbi:Bifunctional inhibitor/plant lipid transfer protein/seed storage helical domain containing protein [Trema orientale]|uniref:Bifunctional inhibitor/plant lipid transfer protein/seed storage helical domain containing protein n=1 Tax=Trema orientale TaxID=63057 RepID=A0A2P5F570_TREOI|nr:Bifunctional inhibitor/plant lipid transfer protein/seed storage helical domain containing protein [Trema orientale]
MESWKRTMVAILVVVMAVLSAVEAQTPSCANNLVDCVDSLNATKPEAKCCNSIKQAVATELSCLCTLYNTPGLLQSFGVTVAQALGLTQKCGVPVKLDQCKSAAPTPQSQPTPGVPGSDGNGAGRAVWTGMSTLFLVSVSMLFY